MQLTEKKVDASSSPSSSPPSVMDIACLSSKRAINCKSKHQNSISPDCRKGIRSFIIKTGASNERGFRKISKGKRFSQDHIINLTCKSNFPRTGGGVDKNISLMLC